jgi:glycosyltransferase involved in cell wall biosynthesis
MRRDISRSDLVVTDSDWTRTSLLKHGLIDESRCLALPIGVDCAGRHASATGPAGLEAAPPYVLFVGRLENRKNLPHIIEAVRPLSTLRLVLLGEPGHGYGEIETLLTQFPADRLVLLHHVSEPELIWLYQHALATLQPSWDEGFGLPVLEAMAAGSPVITSNCSAMAEVAGDAAVLVAPDAPDQSRRALEQLRDDPSLRARLLAAGRLRAQKFSWDIYGERLAGIYRTLRPLNS